MRLNSFSLGKTFRRESEILKTRWDHIKNMGKASVTSPIDFLKNSFEAVYEGYGRCHLGKYKIQMFRKDTEVV